MGKHYRYSVGTKEPRQLKPKAKHIMEQEILEDLKNTYKGDNI